jgi:hypothetical protein
VSGKQYPAYGIVAVVPTDKGCIVRWVSGRVQKFTGVTSQEVLFKVDEAKASTDSH